MSACLCCVVRSVYPFGFIHRSRSLIKNVTNIVASGLRGDEGERRGSYVALFIPLRQNVLEVLVKVKPGMKSVQ